MRRVDFMIGGENFETMTAAHLMRGDPYGGLYYCSRQTKGQKIASMITMGGFGSIPVVDINEGRKLVGIVSEFDLLKALMEKKDLDNIVAEEIMTKNPICVSTEAKANDIITILETKHLIRVPVTDKEGHLVGIIARRDLLQGYLKSKEKPWWF